MRSLILILAIIALALMVVGLFMPLFTVGNMDEVAKKSSTLPALKGLKKQDTTLWDMRYTSSTVGAGVGEVITKTSLALRVDYFQCDTGKLRIQIAEGMAVVACVLGAANLCMSMAMFFTKLLQFPLALYFMFASWSSAAVFGLTLDWYLNGWCNGLSDNSTGTLTTSLRDDSILSWKFGLGWMLIVASAGVSLIASIATMFV